MSLWRFLLSKFTGNGNRLFFASQNVIVLGKKASVERVLGLLQQMMVKRDYLGFISPEDEDKSSPQMLGSLDKATEIISMLHPDEVIFCAGDIPSFEIIRQISHLDKNVEFKIASNSSAAIIGSHSKDDAGELFTLDIGFKIQTPYLKRLKIFTDIHVSLVLIPLIPILVFFQKKPLRFIKNIFNVLFQKKSWVSYCTEYGVSDSLPAILPGVLSPLDNLTVRTQSHDKAFIKRMNYVYARDYSPVTDLRIILNSLNRLDS
jgi:hypothetical protein